MSSLPERVKESEKDVENVEKGSYYVRLDSFEGPFDLLYHLLTKEKMDIWKVPLAHITEQYLKYLRGMSDLQVTPASEFLVMAASLLRLKSRLLLPQKSSTMEEKEEEAFYFGSKEELVYSLLEYKRFKNMAHFLLEREEEQKKIFLRSWGPPKVFVFTRQATLFTYPREALETSLQNLNKKRKTRESKESNKSILSTEEFSFRRTFRHILSILKSITSASLKFRDCLVKADRSELVLTFGALLELAKRGKVSLRQEILFGEIHISGKEKGKSKNDA